MFSFNPLKQKSVRILQDSIVEKEEVIDPEVGIPEVVVRKKRVPKPGMRLVREYKKAEVKEKQTVSDAIESIMNDLILK